MGKLGKYTADRNGRLFWQPGKRRVEGTDTPAFRALGPRTPATERESRRLADDFEEARERLAVAGVPQKAKAPAPRWPAGSLGDFYDAFRVLAVHQRKAQATRDEWEYCWETIGARFGARPIDEITPSEFEAWFEQIEAEHGQHFRWKHVRVARALFNAAVKRHVITLSPAMVLPNTEPDYRSAFWTAAEVAQLAGRAKAEGKIGLWLGIRTGWETMMGRAELISLTPAMRREDADGAWYERERTKTGAEIMAPITDLVLSADLLKASEGLDPHEPILRTSRDGVPYQRVRFTNDFARVRRLTFGPEEKRQFRDIRRSANLEAAVGGASREQRAAVMANALDTNDRLDRTYTPSTVAAARQAQAARLAGRGFLAAESLKRPETSEPKESVK